MLKQPAGLVRAAAVLPWLLAGCGDARPVLEPPASRAVVLVAASPTAFQAPPGSSVTAPVVEVRDLAGQGVPNVAVHFTVGGGGHVARQVVATDAAGRASSGTWVLGAAPGENLLVARVAGAVTPVAFLALSGFDPTAAVYGLVAAGRTTDRNRTTIGGGYVLFGDASFARARVLGGDDVRVHLETGVFLRADSLITFDLGTHTASGVVRGDSLFVTDALGDYGTEVYAAAPPSSSLHGFPEVTRPAWVYNRETPHHFPGGAQSRYVLYKDSSFALQYVVPIHGFGQYRGVFARADSVIVFSFDNPGGPAWRATGTVRGETLVVEYNLMMALSDFEDGVYRLAPGHSTSAAHLFIARADRSAVARITAGGWPAWSPDGAARPAPAPWCASPACSVRRRRAGGAA